MRWALATLLLLSPAAPGRGERLDARAAPEASGSGNDAGKTRTRGKPRDPGYYEIEGKENCLKSSLFQYNHFRELYGLGGCERDPDLSTFHRIARGGAPSAEGLKCLRDLGYTTVVDLRTIWEANKGIKGKSHERDIVEGLGMAYIHFHMSTCEGKSKNCLKKAKRNRESAKAALAALGTALDDPEAKVYVHCARGEDRTGLILGLYRQLADECSRDLVRKEMLSYDYTPRYTSLDAVWDRYAPDKRK